MTNEDMYFKIKIGDITKWSEMYKTEEDLVSELVAIDTDRFSKRRLKGGQFIVSFKKQISEGRELTSKQKTQLKRIAKWVRIYHLEIDMKIL